MHPQFDNGRSLLAAAIAAAMAVSLVVLTIMGNESHAFMTTFTIVTILMVAIATVTPFVLPIIEQRRKERLYIEAAVRTHMGDNTVIEWVGNTPSLYPFTGPRSGWDNGGPVFGGVRIGLISIAHLYHYAHGDYWQLDMEAPSRRRWSYNAQLLVIHNPQSDSWRVIPFTVEPMETLTWQSTPSGATTAPVRLFDRMDAAVFLPHN